MTQRDGIPMITNSYFDCLRICENCEIGFSNSKKRPTIIYKNHTHNIPEFVVGGLDYSLENSLNVFNRKNKKAKFGFSTSEDALTWTFFKYFIISAKIGELFNLLNLNGDEKKCNIYLWGTKITTTDFESDFIEQFVKLSDSFKESKSKRTEPDVIIELPDQIIFIEIKYLSSNEVKNNDLIFSKYLVSEILETDLLRSGHYELYRNWAFVSTLSNGKKFELINLGPEKLFNDKNKSKLALFEKSLKSKRGKFTKLSWENIIDRVSQSSCDEWFKNYLNQKENAFR